MVQRATKADDLAGTLDVSEAQVWADFDTALGVGDLLLDPGPEWCSMAELVEHYGCGHSTVERMVKAQLGKGIEARKGIKGGRTMTLYRAVKME